MTDNPVTDYQAAADVFGSAPQASAQQDIGDWFGKAINGAKDALRVLSYTTMKARAGTVGQNGLGPLLAALHAQSPGIRVHLIGHSFGARLVSFTLAGVGTPANSPIASLLLLQGAFSHWSFAHPKDNPFGIPGALNAYADRVHGPLVATHTVFDWAVGVWYPKPPSWLSRMSRQWWRTAGAAWAPTASRPSTPPKTRRCRPRAARITASHRASSTGSTPPASSTTRQTNPSPGRTQTLRSPRWRS